MSKIPTIPGQVLTAPDEANFLKSLVQGLCNTRTRSFPGSQPVSFTWKSLQSLEKQDYWVCEKSDGVRCLLLILMNGSTQEQETYFIDRKNIYRRVYGLQFPHHEDSTLSTPAANTILDGELVIDHDEQTGEDTLRYLAFDLLVLAGDSLAEKSLQSRYGRLKSWVIEPYKKLLAKNGNKSQPFELKLKTMERAYSIEQVFNEHIPRLKHGNDGLIFTCAESGYVNGTDSRIIKWKEPSENSIDFKIMLRFPPLEGSDRDLDFSKKPICELHQWEGGKMYRWYDNWDITDEEWRNSNKDGIDLHDKIGEFSWSDDKQDWRFLRIRDDKLDGNHCTVVDKIIESIKDGVKASELIENAPRIRSTWKEREQRRSGGLPSQAQPSPSKPSQMRIVQ
ncbi:hypothetical protein E3P99_01779 [Wallemia hederae]|uniref:mRNA-capping enzyme subunit alpha n=1 Tax=Wallemia hederae TaxID=1540922 RepID=A0A4T0FP96_9BASI|nr:hypothetical protein E3P99_01779 [Wallemia hederae]